jgi:hypothetical protein
MNQERAKFYYNHWNISVVNCDTDIAKQLATAWVNCDTDIAKQLANCITYEVMTLTN